MRSERAGFALTNSFSQSTIPAVGKRTVQTGCVRPILPLQTDTFPATCSSLAAFLSGLSGLFF